MNITFIGGGSLRVLPIVRSLLDNHHNFDGGSIRLVDLQLERAEAVGRMIKRCPEFKNVNCQVLWTSNLEKGLEGTDILYITMAIEREPSHTLGYRLAAEYNIEASDNLSANGAFLAARGANAIMSFARMMERVSPDGIMLIFANPVAVFSSMVNNNSKIRALGICAGFHNHKWDLPRMVYGEDRHDDTIAAVAAGVNHLSFILRGEWNGRPLKEIMDASLLRDDWKIMDLGAKDPERVTVRTLDLMQRLYKRFGVMIFSSETDGIEHLFPEEIRKISPLPLNPGIAVETLAARSKAALEKHFREFFAKANGNDESIWIQSYHDNNHLFGKDSHDIANPVLAALGGGKKFRITASAPSRGAVRGFPDDAALEYTMDIQERNIVPVPDQYIPAPFHGLIAELSEYQTILADSVAHNDPKRFADALEAYPVMRSDRKRQEYYCRMLDVFSDLPPVYQKARDYFKW